MSETNWKELLENNLQPGATEEEILLLEAKIGTRLPPSYRNFLKASNGWRDFWSVDQVNWLCVTEPDLVDIWSAPIDNRPSVPDELYFRYGADQDCFVSRDEYLATALALSMCIDGDVYLLNPQVITEDGEWEAWDFGTKHPGAIRYRTFSEMMQAIVNLYSLHSDIS